MRDVIVDHRRTAMAIAAAAALALVAWAVTEPEPAQRPALATAASAPAVSITPAGDPTAPRVTLASQPASAAGPAPLAAAGSGPTPAAQRGQGVFSTDAHGRLMLDQSVRLRVESLLALHEGEALAARVEAELAGLPPSEAARARSLLDQFEAYQAAQRATFPPGQAPLVPEEGLAQLAVLQSLRANHFGAEAAQRMFGEEDRVTRRLLELMRDEKSTHLSIEEKAVRAQARYDIERGAVRP